MVLGISKSRIGRKFVTKSDDGIFMKYLKLCSCLTIPVEIWDS